jgi:hypothetical protein
VEGRNKEDFLEKGGAGFLGEERMRCLGKERRRTPWWKEKQNSLRRRE